MSLDAVLQAAGSVQDGTAGRGRVQHPPDESNLLEITSKKSQVLLWSQNVSNLNLTSADNNGVLASAGFPRFATAFARGSQQDARSRPPALRAPSLLLPGPALFHRPQTHRNPFRARERALGWSVCVKGGRCGQSPQACATSNHEMEKQDPERRPAVVAFALRDDCVCPAALPGLRLNSGDRNNGCPSSCPPLRLSRLAEAGV